MKQFIVSVAAVFLVASFASIVLAEEYVGEPGASYSTFDFRVVRPELPVDSYGWDCNKDGYLEKRGAFFVKCGHDEVVLYRAGVPRLVTLQPPFVALRKPLVVAPLAPNPMFVQPSVPFLPPTTLSSSSQAQQSQSQGGPNITINNYPTTIITSTNQNQVGSMGSLNNNRDKTLLTVAVIGGVVVAIALVITWMAKRAPRCYSYCY